VERLLEGEARENSAMRRMKKVSLFIEIDRKYIKSKNEK
jgi:hypothetical protein